MSGIETCRPKRDAYVIWANKGGVGKTTLTFHMSTVFAEENPDWKVLVCDMCPQANISMTFLADFTRGLPGRGDASPPPKRMYSAAEGSSQSSSSGSSASDDSASASLNASARQGARTVKQFCHKRLTRGMENYQTVGGYIQDFVSLKTDAKRDESEYVIKPCEYNESIPANMFLICGDPALDVSCQRLDQYRRMTPVADDDDPFFDGTMAIRDLIRKACEQIDLSANWAIFIDTNPTLTTYTQLALVAGDYLLIPVNADDFSEVAVEALFDLLYQASDDTDVRYSKCQKLTFAYRAKEKEIPLPKIRLVIHNRQTIYATRASEAFGQIEDVITSTLCDMFRRNPDRFVDGLRVQHQISTQAQSSQTPRREPCLSAQSCAEQFFTNFGKAYTANMKDFHTAAVVCTHTGMPLSKLPRHATIFQKRNKKIKLSKDNIALCRREVVSLVEQLARPPVDRQPMLPRRQHQAERLPEEEEGMSMCTADEPSPIDEDHVLGESIFETHSEEPELNASGSPELIARSSPELMASGSPAYDTVTKSDYTAEETPECLDPGIFCSRSRNCK